jgi:hypothetical protein
MICHFPGTENSGRWRNSQKSNKSPQTRNKSASFVFDVVNKHIKLNDRCPKAANLTGAETIASEFYWAIEGAVICVSYEAQRDLQ